MDMMMDLAMGAAKAAPAAPAAVGTWSEQLREIATFPVIWSLDDESMRTVTGSNLDSLKETGGDTRFDMAYGSGTKPTVETRDGVTVASDNESTVVFQAGASGTLANLWASGKGTLYMALYMNVTPVGDRSILRSGHHQHLDLHHGHLPTGPRVREQPGRHHGRAGRPVGGHARERHLLELLRRPGHVDRRWL